jgi:hypothetical protein
MLSQAAELLDKAAEEALAWSHLDHLSETESIEWENRGLAAQEQAREIRELMRG